MEFYNHLQVIAVVVSAVVVAITAPSAVVVAITAPSAAGTIIAKAGCESSCGNISIPYPFGTTEHCYLDDEFLVVCNKSFDPPTATLQTSTVHISKTSNIEVVEISRTSAQVLNISLLGEMTISDEGIEVCYNSSGFMETYSTTLATVSRFRISSAKNKLTVVGCDTLGIMEGEEDTTYKSGCFSYCTNISDVNNGSCSGVGCCQSSVPSKAQDYTITFKALYKRPFMSAGFNPCSYGFIVEDGQYNFSSADLFDLKNPRNFPMVFDWSVGNQTCEQAQEKQDYVCRGNTTCKEADNVSGYRCSCKGGYTGNPYLHDCIDIDECKDFKLNDCHEKAICKNTVGNYTCKCEKGYHGNGFKSGTGCTADQKNSTSMIVGLSISTSLSTLLCVGFWILWGLKRRKLQQLRHKFFHQNGGAMMLQQLSFHGGTTTSAKIFTEEDLKKATKDFHESRIIGQGGQGTVYKGILADNQEVAIKKARIGDESKVKDFVNEISLLFNVSHKNVVKLLGCCFETQVPTLIYEYISNGSLLDQLKMSEKTTFPWELRLKIATETAEALWYLHSQLSTPIIHRDIKSANILLDKNYTAKVSDFGASRLVQHDNENPKDNTAVQGTIGYLDPEYMGTQQLNERSDVYSFGVVLVELLVGTSVFDFRRNDPQKSLVIHVLSSLKSDNFAEVLDPQIATEKNMEELKAVADLARSCVSDRGEERPTMKQVLSVLEGLRQVKKTQIVEDGGGDVSKKEECAVRDFPDTVNDGDTSGTSEGDSMMAQFPFKTT